MLTRLRMRRNRRRLNKRKLNRRKWQRRLLSHNIRRRWCLIRTHSRRRRSWLVSDV